MYALSYLRPDTLGQAVSLLEQHDEAKLLSGGMTLIPTLKQKLASPSHLVDLSSLPELKGIAVEGDILRIGAASRHVEVAQSTVVAAAIPALAYLASQIADPQVRNRGTMGGSVANNDPAADYPAAVLGLGATVVTTRRRIAADDFFVGMFDTALEPGEILTAIEFPIPDRANYVKFRNPASGYAVVGIFVARSHDDVRVAVTGAGGDGVFRVTEFEEALKKRFSPKSLDGLTVSADGLNSDIHGSAEYRAHLIGVLARRAVEAATAK